MQGNYFKEWNPKNNWVGFLEKQCLHEIISVFTDLPKVQKSLLSIQGTIIVIVKCVILFKIYKTCKYTELTLVPWVLKGQLCWRPQKMMKGPLDELFPSYGCTDAWRNDEMFTCQLSNWKAQQCYQKRQKHALRSCWRHIFLYLSRWWEIQEKSYYYILFIPADGLNQELSCFNIGTGLWDCRQLFSYQP